MRADIQRKPLGFQELTSPKYRCVSICVTRLTRLQEMLAHSLVFKTKGFWKNHLTLRCSKLFLLMVGERYRPKADIYELWLLNMRYLARSNFL